MVETQLTPCVGYLQTLMHKSAVCDCCFEQITGEWLRCVYCSRDLCHFCLQIDTHDDSHFFIVFKSKVGFVVIIFQSGSADVLGRLRLICKLSSEWVPFCCWRFLTKFRQYLNVDQQNVKPPIIPYAVYRKLL